MTIMRPSLFSGLLTSFPGIKPNEEPLEMNVIQSNVTSDDAGDLETQARCFGWQQRFKITPQAYLIELKTSINYLSDVHLIDLTCCVYLEKKFFDFVSKLDTIETLKKVFAQGFIDFVERCENFFSSDTMMLMLEEIALSHVLTVMQMFIGENYDQDFSDEIKRFLGSILVPSFTKNYSLTKWLIKFNLDFNTDDLITGQNILLEAAQSKHWLLIIWLLDKRAKIAKVMEWAKNNNTDIIDFIEEQINIKIKKEQEQ